MRRRYPPHPDFPHPSPRLPPITEWSSDSQPPSAGSLSPIGADQISWSASSIVQSPNPAADLHMLRRLFTRKLAKNVDRVFDDLDKAHIWLRIVREVLRGLKRRVTMEK